MAEQNVFEVAKPDAEDNADNAPKEEEKQIVDDESLHLDASAARPIQDGGPSIDKDWIELGGSGDQVQFEAAPGLERMNSASSSQLVEKPTGITSSVFCCSGGQNINQQQFVVYNRPINRRGTNDFNDQKISVSYIHDPSTQNGCSMGTSENLVQMVHLTFKDFCELLTFKLLCQLEQIEAETVVEASSQNVSCFFWPGERFNKSQQVLENEERQYRLSDFRQSVPLQKRQSQVRALVPITEADADLEEHGSSVVNGPHSELKPRSQNLLAQEVN